MLSVQFLGLDKRGADRVLGTITWDGKQFQTEPEDKEFLAKILDEPVRGKDGQALLSADDPEAFLAALHFTYRAPYFRAAQPVDSTSETANGQDQPH